VRAYFFYFRRYRRIKAYRGSPPDIVLVIRANADSLRE
jgi:hypothetical protein